MIRSISDIGPHRQTLWDQPRVDSLGRQLLIQSTEIISFSDLDASVGADSPQTLFEHCPAERSCGILVPVIKEVFDHGQEIGKHFGRDERPYVGQVSVFQILTHSLQNANSGLRHGCRKAVIGPVALE